MASGAARVCGALVWEGATDAKVPGRSPSLFELHGSVFNDRYRRSGVTFMEDLLLFSVNVVKLHHGSPETWVACFFSSPAAE